MLELGFGPGRLIRFVGGSAVMVMPVATGSLIDNPAHVIAFHLFPLGSLVVVRLFRFDDDFAVSFHHFDVALVTVMPRLARQLFEGGRYSLVF